MKWFVEEFLPITDWWRNVLGWHAGINFAEEFEWEYPYNQMGESVATLRNPRSGEVTKVFTPTMYPGDPTELVCLYWLKQYYKWRGDYDYVPETP